MESKETIEITIEEYEQLIEDSKFLSCLEGAVVDNWEGFDYAIELLEDM